MPAPGVALSAGDIYVDVKTIAREKVLNYTSAPKTLPGFPNASPAKSKNKNRKRWIDDNGDILEWDYKHGEVEKYDKTGKKHKGAFNPRTGEKKKKGYLEELPQNKCMIIERNIVIYDNSTDKLVDEINVDYLNLELLKEIFKPPVEDPMMFFVYDIDEKLFQKLQPHLKIVLNYDSVKFAFQLECCQLPPYEF